MSLTIHPPLLRRAASPRLQSLVLAAALAVWSLAAPWRGSDWPAQLYRVELFRRAGWTLWNNQWYAGHQTLSYSILFPPLASVVGLKTIAILSAAGASWWFTELAERWFTIPAARAAGLVFAVGTVTNVAIGRLTFGLGLAAALASVAAMAEGRRRCVPIALLATLASPVAGVFVVITAAAVFLTDRNPPGRRTAAAMAIAAGLPIGAMALAFPDSGRFPFRFGHATVTVLASVIIVAAAPRRWKTLRVATAVYGLMAIAVFFVPNPLGGNMARLAMFFAAPVFVGMLWPYRKALLVLTAAPLIFWQWQPAIDSISGARHDPSTQASYYQPLLDFVGTNPGTRIEIPFTRRHWEANFVAPTIALARGWERQVDVEVNNIFYGSEIDPSNYRRWLTDNAISFVALPDAELDASAMAEAQLLVRGVPGLEVVFRSAHWTVWKVDGTKPMVEGPATLVAMDTDSFTLDVREPGEVLVRIRQSQYWRVDAPACLRSSPQGWTVVQVQLPGELRVRQDVSGIIERSNNACREG